MGRRRPPSCRHLQLWASAAALMLAFSTCHGSSDHGWVAAQRRNTMLAATGRSAGTAEVLLTATLGHAADGGFTSSVSSLLTPGHIRQPAAQRQSEGGTVKQARRTRLKEVSADAQQGSFKGYKYLPNGALAPGQKRYPVQCPPGTSHQAGSRGVAPMPSSAVEWTWKHKWLRAQFAEADRIPGKGGYDMVMYGDSLTDGWSWSSRGLPVLQTYFGKYRVLNAGISGDQTGPLLWRIKYGGELARVNRPRVVHLFAGTNDFRANPCHGNPLALLLRVQAVFVRIRTMADLVLENNTHTSVVLRTLGVQDGRPYDANYAFPNRFTLPHSQLAAKLRAYAATSHRLHLLDCSRIYLDRTGKRISPQLMPGGLHPSKAGFIKEAQCIAPLINRLLSPATVPTAAKPPTQPPISQLTMPPPMLPAPPPPASLLEQYQPPPPADSGLGVTAPGDGLLYG